MKRRWTPKKHRPCGRIKLGYKYVYLYAAVCPYNGDLIALLLPYMTLECFDIFAQYFQAQIQQKYGQVSVAMINDQASNHQARVWEGTNITMIPLPTACPEINPAERFFEELRKDLSNHVFEDIAQVEDLLCTLLHRFWIQP
ncbi:MAG TPA: transposase, partial [Saprospiraceae bacterium]|nr:transposase [Saprospiraceae bacterium]